MEASVATPEIVADPEPAHDGAAEATRSTEELFQWSGYVHVGAGAEECEHALDGTCRDPKHFHAWVCLPNPYQIRDIQEKARAARARKGRALRDPESDSYAILEGELDELCRYNYLELVQAIAGRRVENELAQVIEEVQGDEQFEHQAQDAEEFQRLTATGEEERDAEEYERLQKQMLDYAAKMQTVIDRRTERERSRLERSSQEDVVKIERESRIKAIVDEVFLHTYYTWCIYVCAREPVTEGFPTVRKFAAPAAQRLAAPEVVKALREKIRDLEQATAAERRGDGAGNS